MIGSPPIHDNFCNQYLVQNSFKLGFFFILGQSMEYESTLTQKSSPDGFILPFQSKQLDDVVSCMVTYDLCDSPAIVRILQFSHR